MTNYTYCLGQQAAEAFGKLDPEQQAELLLVFRGLAQRPFLQGLLETVDATGRSHHMIADAGHLIYFWPDHAIREIRISALRHV